MRKKIFQAMMAAAGSVLLASLIIILGCLYDYFDGLQEKQMQDELTLAAAAIRGKRTSLFGRSESGIKDLPADLD